MAENVNQQYPYFLFTRTPLHVGSGQSVGYVDQPIQREPHTRIPIVPGTSLKGVLRDRWNSEEKKEIQASLFGQEAGEKVDGHAGALLIGEARVLAFPVRSARGCFAWITCPLMLRRYARDVQPDGAGERLDFEAVKEDNQGEVTILAGKKVILDGRKVVLEEYAFTAEAVQSEQSDPRGWWENHLKEVLGNECVWKLIEGRLVIVPDGIFSFFVQSACEVAQHVKIDDDTGTAEEGALFNQENCPPETLFYGMISAQPINGCNPGEALCKLAALDGKALQIGANETTGLGWCTFTLRAQGDN